MRNNLDMGAIAPTVDVGVAYGDDLIYNERSQEVAALTYSSRLTYVPTDDVVQLMGYDPNRSRACVRNMSEYPLLIGTYSDVSASSGYALPAGVEFETQVQAEVYGRIIANAAGALPTVLSPVSVWIESNR